MRWRRGRRGLSEIVGTLMLVLIVVAAATAFAAFVASYQKELEKQRALGHEQALESLRILSLSTDLNGNGTAFSNFSFVLVSGYINPSTIESVSVDNDPLVNYWWENLTDSAWHRAVLGNGSEFTLGAEQEVVIAAHLNASFSGSPPLPNQFVKVDVYTALGNDFGRVFLPPTAYAVASEIDPSGNNPITLLDGSPSFQSGGNVSIVRWDWKVTNATSATVYSGIGEEVEVSPALSAPANPYTIVLTVTNSVGLTASVALVYDSP